MTYAPVIRKERTGADLVTWGEFVEAGYLRDGIGLRQVDGAVEYETQHRRSRAA